MSYELQRFRGILPTINQEDEPGHRRARDVSTCYNVGRMNDLPNIASAFLDILRSHRLERPDVSIASLSTDEAYRVQQLVVDARVEKGERCVGYKVGCTSEAIRRQFALTEPIRGCVMAPYVHHGDAMLNWADYCQPAVEPEFVLTIGKDLAREVGPDEPLEDAIDFVSPGIEVHNYRFWFGEPTIQELIASNGIHAALVVGTRKVSPSEIDWDLEGVGLFTNRRLAASGIGAEIMGGPMKSLRWLVNHLVRGGSMLEAGDVVIPGSPVALVSVNRGDIVTARFTHIGHVDATFE